MQTPLQSYPHPHVPQPAFAPYAQSYAPYPQPAFAPPAITPVVFDKIWHNVKLALTVASLVACLVLIALTVALSVGGFGHRGVLSALWGVPIGVAIGIYDIATLLFWMVFRPRSRAEPPRKTIHPGIEVGFHLVFWLACVLGALFSSTLYAWARSVLRNCQRADAAGSSTRNYYFCDADDRAAVSNGALLGLSLTVVVAVSCLV
jgi:hypothetical protein